MPPVDIDKVNHARVGQNLTDAHAFIERKAAIKRFVKHHSDAHNVVIPNLSADFFQHLDRETHSILE